MKKITLTISAFILFLSIILIAQTDDGRTMRAILKDSFQYIEMIESKGFEIVRMEFDILKDQKETFRYLHEGWTYGILAFGDYRIEDIDIEVYKDIDGQWKLMDQDTEEASNAMVTIQPLYTGMYQIIVKGYNSKSSEEGGHYGLIIFHE